MPEHIEELYAARLEAANLRLDRIEALIAQLRPPAEPVLRLVGDDDEREEGGDDA